MAERKIYFGWYVVAASILIYALVLGSTFSSFGLYILPVSELPIVWAHHKDIVVNKNPLSVAVPILGDYGWKK